MPELDLLVPEINLLAHPPQAPDRWGKISALVEGKTKAECVTRCVFVGGCNGN